MNRGRGCWPALFALLATAGCVVEVERRPTGSEPVSVIAPQMTSWACPRGWLPEPALEGTALEHSICVPPPLRASCADGTMPVLGEIECQPIGDPCPDGDWPRGLPASGVVYVQIGATGGDGSSTRAPLGSLEDAVSSAPAGAVVATAKGTYAEAVVVAKEMTLWGACAAATTIEGPAGEPSEATIEVAPATSLTVRNVTITGPRGGMIAQPGSTLRASGVRVEGASGAGIAAHGASAALDGVVVADTRALPDGTLGRALQVDGGSKATVTRALLDHNRDVGVFVDGSGTIVVLNDVIVRETQSRVSDLEGGRAIGVHGGAQATVARALLDHNRDLGVFVAGAGTDLTLADVVVEDTESRESDLSFGGGLAVVSGARSSVERTLFERNRQVAVFADGSGTEVSLTGVVVRGTRSQESDLGFGRGLGVQSGARASAVRVLFDDNRDEGVGAFGAGTDLALTDVVVTGTSAQLSDNRYGSGLAAQDGARADVLRAWLDHNREAGIVAYGAGTEVVLNHVVVEDTQPTAAGGEYGVGVAAIREATVEMEACRISGNRVAGVLAMRGGRVDIESCEVGQTLPGAFTLLGPDGVTLDGARYDDIADGILVIDGSSGVLSDVRVAGCARAGMLFASSSGSIASVTSTANRYGLVLQGSPQPSYDASTCDFGGNTEQAILTGDVLTPDGP